MAESPSPTPEQPLPECNDSQYWCYHCNKRVSVETHPEGPDFLCRDFKHGFVESIPSPSLAVESILARALEYTLKYWLKSFSRDQFKLQGRTVQLTNVDLNGDALHWSVGLPPALNVATAKVGKLEIIVSN